ncbi:uracil-DNA glycosylase family protein [bacterium]|nr:MAG: uracil-DNA glycosylase family protein [bacterium]
MENLLSEIRACRTCEAHLIHGVNPILAASSESKIAVIGQAPGRIVHQSGKPWDDASGKRLRNWLGVTELEFYNPALFALIPMGFCYPGEGKSGDLPPRKECAPQWHSVLFKSMPAIKMILLIGNYAQSYYLNEAGKMPLTEIVKSYTLFGDMYFPLPHPSPRNNSWLKKNEWFSLEVLPALKLSVKECLK